MSNTIVVEVTRSQTITRANARMLNRKLGTTMSGSTHVRDALAHIHAQGMTPRLVDAATMSGTDKARHTREVTRSRKAQASREARKAEAIDCACNDVNGECFTCAVASGAVA